MNKKMKNLINKKTAAIVVVLIAVIVVIVASLPKNDNNYTGESSGKKHIYNRYINADNTEEETTIPLSEYTIDTVFDVNGEEIKCLFMALIDYAMISDVPMTWVVDQDKYWKGLQIAVTRLSQVEKYKNKIITIEDGKDTIYKVDKDVLENICLALTNMELQPISDEYKRLLKEIVEYDSKEKIYYFAKADLIDYYFEYNNEISEIMVSEIVGEVYGTTSLSKEYPSAYAVKDYKFEVVFPADNSFGISIQGMGEMKAQTTVSPYAKVIYSADNGAEKALDSKLVMDNIVLPYVAFRMEYKDKNEAMWLAIYNSIYRYADLETSDENEEHDTESSFYYIQKLGNESEILVDFGYIQEMINIYTNKIEFDIDYDTMPHYLRELISRDKDTELYKIKIDEKYIWNCTFDFASAKVAYSRYKVYGTVHTDDKDRFFSLILKSEYNNYGFVIEELMY